MAVFQFLDEYDLSEKRGVLFCSHDTGLLASSAKGISAALPGSAIESNVVGVYRDDVSRSRDTVKSWLKEIGFWRAYFTEHHDIPKSNKLDK
ncbi:MAG: hypothetical protein K2J80_14355 [Oscillospiraceae bacterium]|nr:hypothetical protein [Oscillospiraceae bacterium]